MSGTDHARPRRRPGDPSLLYRAAELVIELQLGSPALLQRRLGIGDAKATQLMKTLEVNGIVGPPHPGGRTREVLVVIGQRHDVLADLVDSVDLGELDVDEGVVDQ